MLGDWVNDGYAIKRAVISHEKIDKLLDEYSRNIKTSSNLFLRQNGQFEVHYFSEIGGMRNTLLDPHCFYDSDEKEVKEFGKSLNEIYSDKKLTEYISEISINNSQFLLAQSMFFDQVTTRAHQDCIYLDTNPSGSLVACWIALQDLDETHTKFYVYPGTHHIYLDEKTDSDEYFKILSDIIVSGKYERISPLLKKGDVLFWHSRLIHGSHFGTVSDGRRLSITGHYIPVESKYGKDNGPINGKEIKKYNEFSYFTNPLVNNHLSYE